MSMFDSLVNVVRRATGTQTNIRKALEAVTDHAGVRLLAASETGGGFMLPWEGETYQVIIVSLDDARARVSVRSTIRFPPGRLPARVIGTLERMNEHLPRCRYDTLHGDTDSSFVVLAWAAIPDLTPEGFLEMFGALVGPVQHLDRLLVEYGYAS
jgi:hypothetical protein